MKGPKTAQVLLVVDPSTVDAQVVRRGPGGFVAILDGAAAPERAEFLNPPALAAQAHPLKGGGGIAAELEANLRREIADGRLRREAEGTELIGNRAETDAVAVARLAGRGFQLQHRSALGDVEDVPVGTARMDVDGRNAI